MIKLNLARIGSLREMFPTATRVLRCAKTRRYFAGAGWTASPASALSFANEFAAVRACVAHQLRNVELVLLADSDTEVFSAPVP